MVIDSDPYSSFEDVASGHRIFSVKICLSLRKDKKITVKALRYERSSIDNSDICYHCLVSERFTPNDEYENFDFTHIETTVEHITIKPKFKSKEIKKKMR